MRLFQLAGIGCVLLLAGSGAAAAQGMADLHDKVRVGNKLCMSNHYHSGQSSGQPSKAAAEKEAIRNWQDFTGWEYGSAWGSFAAAVGKSIKCSGGGSNWGCSIEARPCRSR